MAKLIFREIKNSLGRYLAILAIIALGTGFLSGLVVTKPAMIETVDGYVRETAMFDWRLISTLGYESEDVQAIEAHGGVRSAEGAVETAFLCTRDSGADIVLKAHSITEKVNTLTINSGRMPLSPDECVVDWMNFSEKDIGSTVRLSTANDEDTLEQFAYDEYTIVGIAVSPLYINFERGSTSLGNGSVSAYVYIPYEGFDVDYYSDIYVTLEESAGVYTDEYDAIADASEAGVTAIAEERAQKRYERIAAEAEEEIADGQREYDDGYAEYLDGLKEYREEREKAEKELADALDELHDGEEKLSDGRREYDEGVDELNTSVADAEKEIADAEAELADALQELNDGEKDYDEALEKLHDGEKEYAEGLEEYNDGVKKMEDARKELEEAERELSSAFSQLYAGEQELSEGKAELEKNQGDYDMLIGGLTAGLSSYGMNYTGDELIAALEAGDAMTTYAVSTALSMSGAGMSAGDVVSAKKQLDAGWAEYRAGEEELDSAWDAYYDGEQQYLDGKKELDDGVAELADAKAELENARKELDDGWAELENGRRELDDGWAEYNDGVAELDDAKQTLYDETALAWWRLAKARNEMADAETELADGWQEYRDGRAEADEKFADAEAELADAEAELADAEAELADALREVAELEKPDVYVLGRGTNVGYVCFESDSDIVAAIAKVFPVFFFLVAALVCITTMTRMVDEERTEIGVMKAMGFSSEKIMLKYFVYSGSASLIGCIVGFFAGSWLFPFIIWKAYCIMYGFTDIRFYLDMRLGIVSTVAYLAISTGATYLACRNELTNVPAELIRPKAPKAGKRILLERIPKLWKRVKFLHKVSIRNIVRYKQRLFMMILGIGGCTALLITGYGIRDSIQDVVKFQYDEISLYEYTVSFSDGQTPESAERRIAECGTGLGDRQLVFEGSMDVEVDGKVKAAYIVAPVSGRLEGLVDLHYKGSPVKYPEAGEVLICTNLASTFDIGVGDRITLRDSEMRTLELTVSGIFENYVYNYAYVSMDSFAEQWGTYPEMKTLFANPSEGADARETAAKLLSCDGVSAVSSAQDMKTRVNNMMSSLDYIVWLIIACSGALAFIVLYNLTNININERIREIATIKVLGFYPGESASYVFRENVVLTAMGAAVGIPLGIALHSYVIAQVKIDMMHFEARILPFSYIWSLVFTFAFAIIVNIVMYFRLERINMAEALKSVE